MRRNTYFTVTGGDTKIMGADTGSVSKVCEGNHWLRVRAAEERVKDSGGETSDTVLLESGKVN